LLYYEHVLKLMCMERQHYGNMVLFCDGHEQRFNDGRKEFHEGSLETFQ
jgi:prepilin-type processing-associated H-X9-DG protein